MIIWTETIRFIIYSLLSILAPLSLYLYSEYSLELYYSFLLAGSPIFTRVSSAFWDFSNQVSQAWQRLDSNTGPQVITKTKVINTNSNFTNTKVLVEAATKTVTKEIAVTHTYTTTKKISRKADKKTKAI